MNLAYLAYDKSGRRITDCIEAPSIVDATETLRRKGLFVTEIQSAQSALRAPGASRVRGRSRRLKGLAMFMRQLHVLVTSGTPIVQALSAIESQARDRNLRATLAALRKEVEEGRSLSAAMERQGRFFDPITRSLIAVGESSGNLPAMLDRLAVITRKQLHLRSAVIGAIIYPCLLLVVAAAVMTLLLLFVIPRFGELFASLRIPLPSATRGLVSLSRLLHSCWWVILLLVIGGAAAVRFGLTTPTGRRLRDTIVLRLPQVGRIVRSFATARIVRMLGVLLDSRVSVLEALELTKAAAGNCHYEALLERAHERVTRGEPISSAFKDSSLIGPSIYESLRSGEQSGQAGPLLLTIADFLDEDNEVVVRSLTSILEPVILVIMGLLVGIVALSMFMPLFDLTSMTQGGAG